MKLFEIKETMPSVKTLSPKELAKKHNVDIEKINAQVKKGIKVEKEHTDCPTQAKEIALDHIGEYPDYYDRLEKVEK